MPPALPAGLEEYVVHGDVSAVSAGLVRLVLGDSLENHLENNNKYYFPYISEYFSIILFLYPNCEIQSGQKKKVFGLLLISSQRSLEGGKRGICKLFSKFSQKLQISEPNIIPRQNSRSKIRLFVTFFRRNNRKRKCLRRDVDHKSTS